MAGREIFVRGEYIEAINLFYNDVRFQRKLHADDALSLTGNDVTESDGYRYNHSYTLYACDLHLCL